MATPEELYVNGIKRHFRNYFAAWLPNEVIKLGDIGQLRGNIFVRLRNLDASDLNISFKERPAIDPSPINMMSEKGVSIVFKAAGELNQSDLPNIPKAEAGLCINFTREGAFILKSQATYIPSIEDIDEIGEKIIAAYMQGKWKSTWVVVVRVVRAPRATILVSRSSKSKIELQVKGNLNTGLVDIGNANLSFAIRSQSGDLFHSIGATNITPLFQLAKIKTNFLGDSDIRLLSRRRSRESLKSSHKSREESIKFQLITDPVLSKGDTEQ